MCNYKCIYIPNLTQTCNGLGFDVDDVAAADAVAAGALLFKFNPNCVRNGDPCPPFFFLSKPFT